MVDVVRGSLTIWVVAVFAWALLFAGIAMAQEEETSVAEETTLTEESAEDQGVEPQAQESEKQVQSQAGAVPASPSGPLAGAEVRVVKGKGDNLIDKGDILRITGEDYDVDSGASITIEDGNDTSGNADNTQGTYVDGRNATITEIDNGLEIKVEGKPIGKVALAADETLSTKGVEAVTSDGVRVANNSSGDDGGGDGGGGDGVGASDNALDCADFSSQAEAQAEYNSDTNDPNNLDADDDGEACEDFDYGGTGDPQLANDPNASDNSSASADAQTANDGSNGDRSADTFRCDFFLHVVRDDQGALDRQYNDDELIVRRFEQCLSEDVLTDTIPHRRLPGTGGPLPLLFGGGLLATGLALAGRIIKRS
jgi:hypothetical protein